jgi:hypothetical protein
MKNICFDDKVPDVNCRTCCFSEPNMKSPDGIASWKCYKKGCNFTGQGQLCEHHLFLNTLVPMKTIDADKSEFPTWLKYEDEDGNIFYNVSKDAKVLKGSISLSSKEIYEKEYFELIFSGKKEKVKEKLEGEI